MYILNIISFLSTPDVVNKTTDILAGLSLQEIINSVIIWAKLATGKIILSLLLWFVGKKIIQYGMKLIFKALDKTSLDTGVVKFLCSLIRFGTYVILIIQIIRILGFETTSIITLLGSAGLAFGLALQGSLSNFAGGVLILIFRPFRVGDYIISSQNEGTVKVIDLLYTRLQTPDNKIITIPNGTLANSSIINVGSQDIRRLDIPIPLGYNSDLAVAKELLHQIMENQEQVIKDNEISIIVKNYDQNTILLETRAWVKSDDYWNTRCELLEKYKEVFDNDQIEYPLMKMDQGKEKNIKS